MIRVTIKKGTKWLQVFSLAGIFERYLKLTKYDAMRLAYTTQKHDVLIQGSNKDLNLYALHVKLHRLNMHETLIEELEGFKVQVNLTEFEPQRLGYPYRNKKLWESKTNLLIFRSIES